MSLEFRDVSVAYGANQAVRGVSLSVQANEIVGMTGESGSGKSTLALAALRLLPAEATLSGQVLINGVDLAAMSWGELRVVRWNQLSIVFQSATYGLNPVRTIGGLVAEPMLTHRHCDRATALSRAAGLLAEVGLPGRVVNSYPHQLSGGQRQRAMIALALACEPEIVVADEATTALDAIVQAQVLDVLARVAAARRIGLLMISHDRPMLRRVCDRILVLSSGRLVDSPEQPDENVPSPGDQPRDELLLRADELTVRVRPWARRRHTAPAVDRVSLDLHRGEVLAVVGETGGGKTTLIRALLGLIPISDGSVSYTGGPMRREVQFVPQDPADWLNPRYPVYEAIAEGVRIHRLDNEFDRVRTALHDAGLRPAEDYFDRLPASLSGGQRQRVAIAGALVLDPEVLIADEPVASLDPRARREFVSLLRRLRALRGIAALVVTHDLTLATQAADRIAVMYLGRIVEEGPAAQILSAPAHPYTRALLSTVPQEGLLPTEPPDLTAIPAGCRFHPRCPVFHADPGLPCRTQEPPEIVTAARRVACHRPS